MAEPALPQKPETTPVIRPLRSPPASTLNADPQAEYRKLPLRRPPELPAQVTASPVLQPLPKPASILSGRPGPKNETARIAIPPGRSAAAGTAQTGFAIIPPSAASDAFDSTPRWFCWGLLGLSALIFLIQIWNYALS